MNLLDGDGLDNELNPSWVDKKVILGWYESCLEKHGKKCTSPPYLQLLPRAQPAYFIDVTEERLVRAPARASYAALSYVWGQITMLKATQSNITRLEEPQALADPKIADTLPRTVRHAIYLMKKLKGLGYLWVDALCILQKEEDMLNAHLSEMGSIYANASIVITAMDGTDAECGLRGLRNAPETVPRDFQPDLIPFGSKSFVVRRKMGASRSLDKLPETSYHSRGWTFQEHFFSRRCICFENDSVWFGCCASSISEDRKKSERPDDTRDWILDVGYPSNTALAEVIREFNKRYFYFPQDCLSAFSGVISCYTKVYTGGFVSGLPEMFFDAMLLWQPGGDLVRRVPVANRKKPLGQSAEVHLPSWSWVGWQGRLAFDGWDCANNFVAACSGWIRTTRCELQFGTCWSVSKDPSGKNGRQLIVLWLDWGERYKDPRSKLPHGWTRRLKKKDQGLTCEHPPWFPLPLANPEGVPRADADAPYLCGEVDTVHVFTLGGVSIVERRGNRYACISLSNHEGKWIGMLRLHSVDYFERKGIHPASKRVPMQLIGLSRGFIPNGLNYEYVDEYVDEDLLK